MKGIYEKLETELKKDMAEFGSEIIEAYYQWIRKTNSILFLTTPCRVFHTLYACQNLLFLEHKAVILVFLVPQSVQKVKTVKFHKALWIMEQKNELLIII